MVVAPEAIVEQIFFFEYGLERLLLFTQVQFYVGFFDLSFPKLTNSNHHWNIIVFNVTSLICLHLSLEYDRYPWET
jgi:hypothetical protein